jgi:dTDP-4-dehydrorhamnose 3,5-epimerase-like enzyme
MSDSDKFQIIEFPVEAKDERGWMFRPVYNVDGHFQVTNDDGGAGDIKNLHVVSLQPGVVRGDHYHKLQLEFLVLMGGKVEVKWQAPGEEARHSRTVDTQSPVLLRVPPNVVHSIKNVSDEVVYVICYSQSERTFRDDSNKVRGFHEGG